MIFIFYKLLLIKSASPSFRGRTFLCHLYCFISLGRSTLLYIDPIPGIFICDHPLFCIGKRLI